MIDGGGPRILRVARITRGRQSYKLSDGRALVTVGAFRHRVRPYQRKPVGVVLDFLRGYLPALHRVASFAVGAELTHVNVGVAIGAMRTHVLEHHRRVALRTAYLLVHAAQRIRCLVVIELGHCPDWLPAGVRMTVLARPDGGAMRIDHLGPRALSGLRNRSRPRSRGRRRLRQPAVRRRARERHRQQRHDSRDDRCPPVPR